MGILQQKRRTTGKKALAYREKVAKYRARKKPINTNILGGTVLGTNRNRPRDKPGPVPGTNWAPSLGQTGLSLFNSTVKSLFCPVCPWEGWGFVPGTIVPQGPSEKCLCVFCLLFFFAPKNADPAFLALRLGVVLDLLILMKAVLC